jgi:hypothetical protein
MDRYCLGKELEMSLGAGLDALAGLVLAARATLAAVGPLAKSENGSNITGPNGLISAAGLFNLGSSGLAMKMVRCSLVLKKNGLGVVGSGPNGFSSNKA